MWNHRTDEGLELTVRRAVADDAARLERLAALDSASLPRSPLLVAEMNGRLLAALPLDGGPSIADPFAPTAALVELLRLRSAQLHATDGDERTPRFTRRLAAAFQS